MTESNRSIREGTNAQSDDATLEGTDTKVNTATTGVAHAEAADPTTNADRALLAGYWLQVCQGGDTFTAHAAQKELTHLGRKLPNITNALTDLKEAKPQLVLQLRKSGKTQQARKTYKVSGAGVKRVEEMIGG